MHGVGCCYCDVLSQAYAVFSFLWHYAIPLCVFAYCYAHVFHVIRRQRKVVSGHMARIQGAAATAARNQNIEQVQRQETGVAAASGAKLSRSELNVLQTMIAVIVCFVACWSVPSVASFLMRLEVRYFATSCIVYNAAQRLKTLS